jgi:predicted negative regulator of RcsB-dependent stress response
MSQEPGKEKQTSVQVGQPGQVMKAAPHRKHETSALAERLTQVMAGVRQRVSRNVLIFLGVVVAAALVGGIWYFVSSRNTEKNAEAWIDFQRQADLPEPQPLDAVQDSRQLENAVINRLKRFAQEHPDSTQGRASSIHASRKSLYFALRDLGFAPANHGGKIRPTAEAYEDLAQKVDNPHLAQMCLLGAAQARETLGEYDQAKAHYDKLVKDHKDSTCGKLAAEALERMEKPGARAEIESVAARESSRAGR